MPHPPLIEDTVFYAELERHGLVKTPIRTKHFTYWQTQDGKISGSVPNLFGFVPSKLLYELLAQFGLDYQEHDDVN